MLESNVRGRRHNAPPRVYGSYLRSVTGAIPEWDLVLAYEVLPSLSVGVRGNERNDVLWETQTTWRF